MRTIRDAGVMVLVLLGGAGCAQRLAHVSRNSVGPTAVSATMRRQIVNAADAGEGDVVVNQLRSQMAADASDVSLRLQLAEHYRKIGLPELEMEHLRLAVERFPQSREAHLALADALRTAGQPRRAAELLEGFTQNNASAATDVAVLNRMGICYDESGDWKAGEQAFRRAIAAASRLDYLHNNLGYNLLEQQRYPEAIQEFEQALKSNPNSAVPRNNLGVALARAAVKDGRIGVGEALRHFENVADAATAYNNLAAVLIEQARYDESRRLLQTALDYNRSHAAALANLRLVAELDGKPAELAARPPSRSRGPLALLKRIFVKTETRRSSDPLGAGMARKGELR